MNGGPTNGRYSVVGLGGPRATWPSEVSRWANSGAAPLEFLTCLSGDEVRALLGSGRAVTAVLLDATARVDRDLVADAARVGAVPIGVDNEQVAREWDTLGCSVVLPSGFSAAQLLEVLQRWCRTHPTDTCDTTAVVFDDTTRVARGSLVAVTGAGGAGSSVIAMAAAQALARTRSTALVDGARRADLAMYHDIGDVVPGLPELVEAHRGGTCDPEVTRSLLFHLEDRHHDLLLGLRRLTEWSVLRPAATAAAIDGLLFAYDTVVVDHDPDLDDEACTGSFDVEDRNAVALSATARASLLLCVVDTSAKGLHALSRLAADVTAAGVSPERIVVVVNKAPSSPAARSRFVSGWHELSAHLGLDPEPEAPVFMSNLRRMDQLLEDARPFPDTWVRPLARRLTRRLAAVAEPDRRPDPSPIGTAGSRRRAVAGAPR